MKKRKKLICSTCMHWDIHTGMCWNMEIPEIDRHYNPVMNSCNFWEKYIPDD